MKIMVSIAPSSHLSSACFTATYSFNNPAKESKVSILEAIKSIIKRILKAIASTIIFGSQSERKKTYPTYREVIGGEELWLQTPDQRKIEARYITSSAQDKNSTAQKVAILFTGSHNSYEHFHYGYSMVRPYVEKGYHVLCVNYGGFGLSEGSPSQEQLELDAETAYQYVSKHQGIADENILVHGYSLGSYPATFLSVQHPIGKLVFDRGFSQISKAAYDMGIKQYPQWLCNIVSRLIDYTHPLNNEKLVCQLQAKKAFFIRGELDQNMQAHHNHRLQQIIKPEQNALFTKEIMGHLNNNSVWYEDCPSFDEWLAS